MPFLTYLEKQIKIHWSVEFRVPTAFAWVVVTFPIKNTISRECDSIKQTLQIHKKMTKYDICGCLQIHHLLLLLQIKQYWEFVVKDDKYMQLHL